MATTTAPPKVTAEESIVEPATPRASKEPSEYIVFKELDAKDEIFQIIGRGEHMSKAAALDATTPADDDGPFVAIAGRYWDPVRSVVVPPKPPKRAWK
jgi:hypothetical protein